MKGGEPPSNSFLRYSYSGFYGPTTALLGCPLPRLRQAQSHQGPNPSLVNLHARTGTTLTGCHQNPTASVDLVTIQPTEAVKCLTVSAKGVVWAFGQVSSQFSLLMRGNNSWRSMQNRFLNSHVWFGNTAESVLARTGRFCLGAGDN